MFCSALFFQIPSLKQILPTLENFFRTRILKYVRSPEIDSKVSILSVYVAWQAGTTTLFDVPTRQAT
jgi:hypothetical protein